MVNTRKLRRTTRTSDPVVHTRDMSYYIPSATLIAERDPAGVAPAALANMVGTIHLWAMLMERGQRHSERAEWVHTLRTFNRALNSYESVPNFPNSARYKHQLFGQLGNTNRRFGRHEQVRDILEKALEMALNYNTAKRLGNNRARCRVVGNLGMVDYQLAGWSGSPLLDVAIEHLTERITSVRRLEATFDPQSSDPRSMSLDRDIFPKLRISRMRKHICIFVLEEFLVAIPKLCLTLSASNICKTTK
ncbi:hypothetical protein BKA82DRAFT_32930 [Pisolithus tinctorius]|uniref:Uncharacterized protein n=1 Tax=Pisolithus tinctorius Marx 270 TaxID=870435 RepID=A0A0C3JGR8_PISTI|nr:hypothetical protein BKA82DRAFT_32930 [Pisolithus tinctorius]KIN96791.1 hypothetical protein M404DRAFT_32930 [Pisolithus tinctorius Marx 270]